MKAMIMAAGKGTRLGKMTNEIPKALAGIHGRSILRIAVEKCTSQGFDDIIINVHHFADKVISEAEKLIGLGFRITISDESSLLLETGGGLFKARHFFDDAPFLLYNVDIITDLDLAELYSFHLQNKGVATLAVRNRPGNRYFLVDNNGLLSGWCNKSTGEKIICRNDGRKLSEIAFSGIHIIEPEIFNYMEEGVYSMTSLYLRLAGLHPINTFRYDTGYWIDIGTHENLEKARELMRTL
jgi:NDP-sugar pyrophosphorylase family protein